MVIMSWRDSKIIYITQVQGPSALSTLLGVQLRRRPNKWTFSRQNEPRTHRVQLLFTVLLKRSSTGTLRIRENFPEMFVYTTKRTLSKTPFTKLRLLIFKSNFNGREPNGNNRSTPFQRVVTSSFFLKNLFTYTRHHVTNSTISILLVSRYFCLRCFCRWGRWRKYMSLSCSFDSRYASHPIQSDNEQLAPFWLRHHSRRQQHDISNDWPGHWHEWCLVHG